MVNQKCKLVTKRCSGDARCMPASSCHFPILTVFEVNAIVIGLCSI